MRTLVKLLAGLATSAILAGCVAGQSLQTDYVAPEATAPLDGTSILLTVSEDRPYVKSGDKPPYYIGKYRAGFGNPWDVTTDNNEPNVQRSTAWSVVQESHYSPFSNPVENSTVRTTRTSSTRASGA